MFRRHADSATAERSSTDLQLQPSRSPGVAGVLALLGIAVLVQYLGGQDLDRQGADRGDDARRVRPDPDQDRAGFARPESEILRRGWKDILSRVYQNVTEHRIMALAAGMTFYNLLAIFPALAALVAVYGLFADPATVATHLEELNGLLPSGALDIVADQLTRVASKGTQALGMTFIVSLVISLWSANAAMKSLFDTLNIVYGAREERSFIKLNATSLLFTAAAILFALLSIGAVVVLPVVLNYVGLSVATDLLLRVGRWPAIFICTSLALALVYRYGPDREAPRWHWPTWGGVLAAALWLAASGLFSWYAAHFGNFDATYGSLGAAIGFMTWLWISAIVILIGGEIDAEIEQRSARVLQ